MNPDTKYIGIGLLIGGVIAAIIMMGAFFAGFLPWELAPVSAAPPELPESISFALDVTPASAFTPIFTPVNTPVPVISPISDSEILLADQINQTMSAYGGEWNILIRADDNHTVYSHDADQKNHAASIIKVPIAMLFFKSLEEKGITPSEYADYLSTRGIGRTYMQLLKAMLVDSEEAAAKLLWGYIQDSGLDFVATLKSWGAFNTDIGSRYSTPEDIAALYECLYFGNAVTPEARQIILDLMSAYTANDDTRLGVLRPFLPPGGMFYNKRGTITDGRLIIGDAALLTWNQNGQEKVYVVVILSYNGKLPITDHRLEHGIEAIAHLFWDFAAPKDP